MLLADLAQRASHPVAQAGVGELHRGPELSPNHPARLP
jgi:hypothetical protein